MEHRSTFEMANTNDFWCSTSNSGERGRAVRNFYADDCRCVSACDAHEFVTLDADEVDFEAIGPY